MTKSSIEPGALPRMCGRRLRQLRDRHQLTQAELAERAHLDVSYISQIENGHRDPSLTSLGALTEALGVSLSTFFEEQEPATIDAEAVATRATIEAELRRLNPAQALLVLDAVRLFVRAFVLAPKDVPNDPP